MIVLNAVDSFDKNVKYKAVTSNWWFFSSILDQILLLSLEKSPDMALIHILGFRRR